MQELSVNDPNSGMDGVGCMSGEVSRDDLNYIAFSIPRSRYILDEASGFR